jgi:hypothetical protein
MKNYALLFIVIIVNSCFAMETNDLFKLPPEQLKAYIERQLQASYTGELFYVSAVPRRLAEKYFHEWNDYYKTHNNQSFDTLWMFWEKNKNDNNALLIERYVKAIVSNSFALRNPQLPLDETGQECVDAIYRVNSDLRVLHYIVTGKIDEVVLQPEAWQEYWNKMVQVASGYTPIAESGPKILKRVRFSDTPSYKKVKKQ